MQQLELRFFLRPQHLCDVTPSTSIPFIQTLHTYSSHQNSLEGVCVALGGQLVYIVLPPPPPLIVMSLYNQYFGDVGPEQSLVLFYPTLALIIDSYNANN